MKDPNLQAQHNAQVLREQHIATVSEEIRAANEDGSDPFHGGERMPFYGHPNIREKCVEVADRVEGLVKSQVNKDLSEGVFPKSTPMDWGENVIDAMVDVACDHVNREIGPEYSVSGGKKGITIKKL